MTAAKNLHTLNLNDAHCGGCPGTVIFRLFFGFYHSLASSFAAFLLPICLVMFVSCQYIIAKGILQFAVSAEIIHRAKVGAIVSLLKGAINKIMFNISIPVIPKGILKIRVFLSIFNDVYHFIHLPAFGKPVHYEMIKQSVPVIAEFSFEVRVLIRIITFVKNIFYACCLTITDATQCYRSGNGGQKDPSAFFCCPCQPFLEYFTHWIFPFFL